MDGIKRLSGCCACCGAPYEPTLAAMESDGVCSRSFNFIQGEALQHSR